MGMLQKALVSLLVLVFFMAGFSKLTPSLNAKAYEQQKELFQKFAKVHPFVFWFGHEPDADQYRMVIGVVEVICSALLIIGPRPLSFLSSVILLTIMIGAVQSIYMIGERQPAQFAPAVICGTALMANIFLMAQGPDEKQKKT